MTTTITPTHAASASTPASVSADINTADANTLQRLAAVIDSRKGGDPDASYVARLFHKGDDAVLKKIGEEATEVVLAAKDVRHGGEQRLLVGEFADLWFHCLVALSHFGLHPSDVLAELARREGLSGLEEKALRKQREREKSGE
jgi:phosphoribosyl-ATP pyrophosphohydrolase